MVIKIKRVYEPPSEDDGLRFLVDRLWPRGIKKEALVMDGWFKECAPSHELRLWFGHDPVKWEEFQRRYWTDLQTRPDTWEPILEAARRGNVTLLYSRRDSEHNNALVLKYFLEERIGKNLDKFT